MLDGGFKKRVLETRYYYQEVREEKAENKYRVEIFCKFLIN